MVFVSPASGSVSFASTLIETAGPSSDAEAVSAFAVGPNANVSGRVPIETFFDLIEYDEGRDPVRDQPWEKI